MSAAGWYRIANPDEVYSPALLVFPTRVEQNIDWLVQIAGGADRLRPHVKTHKLPEIIRLQQARGISKFKCATIAEAEMLGRCAAKHVILAYPPVGPNIDRLVRLAGSFRHTRFAAIADEVQPLYRQPSAQACISVP